MTRRGVLLFAMAAAIVSTAGRAPAQQPVERLLVGVILCSPRGGPLLFAAPAPVSQRKRIETPETYTHGHAQAEEYDRVQQQHGSFARQEFSRA